MNHRRTGKIARLPEDIRNRVNELLDDGVDYPHIIDYLTQAGYPGIYPKNLSNWKDGGYEDWLKHCQRLEELELKTAYAVEVARGTDATKFQEAAVNLTAVQFYDLLNRFDPHTLTQALREHPEKFPAVINSFAKLTREVVGLERFRAERKEAAKREAELNQPAPAGLTEPTIIKMLTALRIRYPEAYAIAAQAELPAESPTQDGGKCS